MKRLLRWRPIHFKQKLILYSLLLSTVPILLLGLISSTIAARSMQQVVETKNRLIVNQVETQLAFFMKQLASTAVMIASDSNVVKAMTVTTREEAINARLDMIKAVDNYRNFSPIDFKVSVIYPQNDYVYSSTMGISTYDNSLFRRLIQQRGVEQTFPFYVTPDQRMGQNELLLFMPVPISSTFATNGVLVLHVTIHELTRVLKLPDGSLGNRLFLVDESGKVVMSGNPADIGHALLPPEQLQRIVSNSGEPLESIELDQIRYKVFAKQVESVDWTFIQMTAYSELAGESELIRAWTLGIAGALLLIWIFVALLTSRQLYSPIERLLNKIRGDAKRNDADNAPDDSDVLQKLELTLNQIMHNHRHLQRRLNEYLPFVQERAILHLMRDGVNDDVLSRQIGEIEILSGHRAFAVAIAQIDRPSDFLLKYPLKDRPRIQDALCKLMEELFEPVTPAMPIVLDPMRTAVIIGWKTPQPDDAEQQMLRIADEFRRLAATHFHFTTSVTISRIREGVEGVHIGYQKALELLNRRMLLGQDVTIFEDAGGLASQQPTQVIFRLQKPVLEALLACDEQAALAGVEEMFRAVQAVVSNSSTVFGVLSYFIGRVEELMDEVGLSLHEGFDYDLYEHMYSLGTLADIRQWMAEELIPGVIRRLQEGQAEEGERLVEQAMLYVQLHYDRDLSLLQLADMYGVTPSKLSRLFKLKTGAGFGDYVTAYRMEKAMEMLRRTDLSVQKIAEQLRYTAVQSFNRAFRRATGMSPGDYRRLMQKQEQRQAEA